MKTLLVLLLLAAPVLAQDVRRETIQEVMMRVTIDSLEKTVAKQQALLKDQQDQLDLVQSELKVLRSRLMVIEALLTGVRE